MIARPYQTDAVNAIVGELGRVPSSLLVMATGLGKTCVFSLVARDWPRGRVLVLAHREELIQQSAEKVQAITGRMPDVEMAQSRANGSRIIVGSVQTMCRERRLSRFDPAAFGLVVVDEAHHAPAPTYGRILAHFRRNDACRVLGVTATPVRADEQAMSQVFDSVCYEYGIEAAVNDGWLVPVSQRVVLVDGLDFSKVRTIAGDFDEGQLERIMSEEKVLHRVAAPAVELTGDRPALVFCVTVAHARLMAEVLNRYKPKSSHWLCGDRRLTPPDQRREWVQRFRDGKVQFLASVGLFSEGFDAPRTAVLVMARPTKSEALYQQMLGRGTRPLPGVVDGPETPEARRAAIAASAKVGVTALDFVGNSGRHKIVTCADLLGGKYDEPVREYAKKTLADEKRPAPVKEALDRAEAELMLLEEEKRRVARLAAVKAEADYRTVAVSPFGGSAAAASGEKPRRKGIPATERQVRYLLFLGVREATARGYSKRQASAVIDDLVSKREGGT